MEKKMLTLFIDVILVFLNADDYDNITKENTF